MSTPNAKRSHADDPEMVWDDELGWLHVIQLSAFRELEQQAAEMREALEGAQVLAQCLAETKDDARAFLDNNDNVMRIQDALSLDAGKGYVRREDAMQLVSCLNHIKSLAVESREKPEIVLAAVGLSALAGVCHAKEKGLA